jgi:hypothetical protein
LEMIMMVKLFHWKTHSYATHKATDELYSKLNEHVDQFIIAKPTLILRASQSLLYSIVNSSNHSLFLKRLFTIRNSLIWTHSLGDTSAFATKTEKVSFCGRYKMHSAIHC